jgi:hypothetical protein
MTLFKKFIYIFFANIININLFFLKNIKRDNFVYFRIISFGDTFTYYINNYSKIKNKKIKILVFSQLEKKIADFFFTKNKIKKLLFLVPNFIPMYTINDLLNKKKYFIPSSIYDLNQAKLKVQSKHKNLLINLLKSKLNLVSENLKKIQNEKYCVIFIKHNNNNKNDIAGSNSRQTSDLNKIFKVINFLTNYKFKIVILGDKNDKSLDILKIYYKNDKDIIFFKDLSDSYSVIDQLFVHQHSTLTIGNCSGALIIPIYLKKKIIFFDYFKQNYYSLVHSKNIKNFYKKIIFNNKVEVLTEKILKNISNKKIPLKGTFKIKENSYNEIKKHIQKYVSKFY